MLPAASSDGTFARSDQRLEVLFDELAELTGQRNAIDGRIVEIAAEIDRDELWGATGARSVAGLMAWKTGISPGNAKTIAAVARRLQEFPRCAKGLRDGRFSLDQVGVIAQHAGEGSDEHYAELANCATVSQLRTAVRLEPRPDPQPDGDPDPDADDDDDGDGAGTGDCADPGAEAERERDVSITKTTDAQFSYWRIKLSPVEAAKFDAALQSHLDALFAEWKRDHESGGGAPDRRPPMPTTADAFMRLVEAGWDAEAVRRPHGQQTTVVVHLDIKDKAAALHLGPLLSESERQYVTCDATCEVWFKREGEVIGAGRTTRTISRRLRRALEHRHPTCAVPGCESTRGLHAHHIEHWENGGPTELHNLVLLCPFHHRSHHRGIINIIGPADKLRVTDRSGKELSAGSLARPPTKPPPSVPPCPGPTGERADWWWYEPYKPQSPPMKN